MFKKISEYIISLNLALAFYFLSKKKEFFDEKVVLLFRLSILLTIGSELAFTFYIHVYGFSNFTGHFLKIISYYLIYKAIIETGLGKPYDLLFRNLKENESKLNNITSAAFDAIIMMDHRGNISFWNEAAERVKPP